MEDRVRDPLSSQILGQRQERGASSGSPMWLAGAQTLGQSVAAFLRPLARSWVESKATGTRNSNWDPYGMLVVATNPVLFLIFKNGYLFILRCVWHGVGRKACSVSAHGTGDEVGYLSFLIWKGAHFVTDQSRLGKAALLSCQGPLCVWLTAAGRRNSGLTEHQSLGYFIHLANRLSALYFHHPDLCCLTPARWMGFWDECGLSLELVEVF